jgi:hypothetical protein
MTTYKVLISFTRISVALLIEFARNTVSKMAGNSLFANPDVSLADITAKADTTEEKFLAAQGGGKLQKRELRDARKALIDILKVQAIYVHRTALGNDTVIVSSGFDCSKPSFPRNYPEFVVEHGAFTGEVIARRKAIANAKSYVWQY